DINNMLNKQSGMQGLCGLSDMRDIKKAITDGHSNAKLAYDMYAYRIKKYIGMYAAVLNGIDALVFTAGVGENDAAIRQLCCEKMDYLGIVINEKLNENKSPGIRNISGATSKTKILVIPTNEELEIAKQCFELIKQ
ncbi:MAG: acetate kinase, partial [Chitinophagaceae bacterium]